jgi:hypothetical protein
MQRDFANGFPASSFKAIDCHATDGILVAEQVHGVELSSDNINVPILSWKA